MLAKVVLWKVTLWLCAIDIGLCLTGVVLYVPVSHGVGYWSRMGINCFTACVILIIILAVSNFFISGFTDPHSD